MSDTRDSECRLFYRTDPEAVFARLTRTLIDAFAATAIDLRPRLASSTELVFASGGMTLSVVRMPCALDMQTLAPVNRPEAATMDRQDALDDLAGHQSVIAIRVMAPAHVARKDTRLAICYIAVLEMLKLARPDHVHWGNSNTLYTIAEFCSSTGAHVPIKPRHTVIPGHRPKAHRPERAAFTKPRVFGRTVVPTGRWPRPCSADRTGLFAARHSATATASTTLSG